MKRLGIFFVIGLLSMFAIIGCEKDSSSTMDDKTLSQMELQESALDEENDYLMDWGIDDGDENNMYDGFSTFSSSMEFPKIMDPINNVARFGRKINNRFRRQVIFTRINEDSALVSITRELRGNFVSFEKIDYDTTDPDTLALYRKPLRHIVKRKAIFVKRNSDDQYEDNPGRGRWKLQAVTLGDGKSYPTNTIQIHEVVIHNSAGDSIVFTDPLETFLSVPEDIPTFNTGEMVTIRVKLENTTGNPFKGPDGATETLLLHYGINRFHHARKRFTYMGIDQATGDNVYEGFWRIGQQPYRVRHAIVDAIDNGTIYDNNEDDYPYNSTTWGAPYRVVPN